MHYLEPSGNLDAWSYCENKARKIEVVYKNEELDEEVLARVHFIMNNEVGTIKQQMLVAYNNSPEIIFITVSSMRLMIS